MDFFAAQDRARRKTWQLVVLFTLAVAALILTTNLLVALVAAFTTTSGLAMGVGHALGSQSAATWMLISGIVLIVVAGASLSKYLALRSGGRAVVELLGGQKIDSETASPAQRRLLNVVEEMSIAAGIPVPAVYQIDEDGINAFAAGFAADDAVIGVTRGTLDHLNRDELQGVIGHEFSHILNGDSRINLRLIAILNGIVFLGVIGQLVLRYSGRSRRNSNALPVVALGLGLIVIGAAGTFCGNLIKAAVSRQREFLADAASVQFTRNPSGIANALKKIGGSADGSRLNNAHAVEMSHMFFGQAIRTLLGGMMATHPPLPERIRAIEPNWDGQFLSGAAAAESGGGELAASFAGPAPQIADAVGNPTAASLEQANSLIHGLPGKVADAAHEAFAARLLVYALLLAADPAVRQRQLAGIQTLEPDQSVDRLALLLRETATLDAMQRLTAVSLATPALKTMSQQQYVAFVANVIALIRADRAIDLFEWVLHRVLLQTLKPHFEGARRTPVRYTRLSSVTEPAAEMLSAIVRVGSDATQRDAYEAAMAVLGLEAEMITAADPNFTRLGEALRQLRAVSPLLKPRLLKACALCAAHDGVGVAQRALLIGIAATLDCPLPPDLALENF